MPTVFAGPIRTGGNIGSGQDAGSDPLGEGVPEVRPERQAVSPDQRMPFKRDHLPGVGLGALVNSVSHLGGDGPTYHTQHTQ